MMIKGFLVATSLVALATAAQATTVIATYTAGVGTTVTRTIVNGAGTPSNNAVQNASQFSMRLNGGTFTTPLVGSAAVDFFAWCIEPREIISLNVETTYTVLPLSQAATNIGGIGDAKAAQMRELFGRFQSSFATPVTAQHAAAMQIAIWEIVRETPGAALNVFNGNILYTAGSDGIAGTLALANSYVTAIDGTGPMARNLLTLSNGTFGVQGSGTQDLIVQTMSGAVPEPASWAMLIVGFGLVGAARRRRVQSVLA